MPIDASKGWWRPNGAAEWTTLLTGAGIANPDHSWDCTVGSGNLSDQIGSLTLTATGTLAYAQAATGWTGTGINAADGAAARITAGAGAGPDPDVTSQVWLVMLNLASSPLGTNRAAFGINSTSAANSYRMLFLTSGLIRGAFAGANVDGAATHGAGDYVMVMRYDRAASVAKLYSDLETITNVYSATTLTDNPKGIGSAAYPGGVTFFLVAMWEGANAETLDDAAIATIRSRIETPVSGGATGHYYRTLLRMMGAD